jgi:hypothetical protein
MSRKRRETWGIPFWDGVGGVKISRQLLSGAVIAFVVPYNALEVGQ